MPAEQALLSICIPTFNRPAELRKTLSIVATQVAALPENMAGLVECIVSDNHSSYDAGSVIAEFAARLDLDLSVQDRNVGPTLNFEFCYARAHGRFVLILSDDDHLVPGALAAVLQVLAAHDPDIVFLPFTPMPKTADDFDQPRRLERNDFLASVGVLPSLISACILKRDRITDVLGSYLDTNIHHYHYFLHALEHGETFYAFSHQMLECPYEHNAGGYNWFAVFGEQFYRIVDEFPARRIHRAILTAIERRLLVDRIIPTFVNRRILGYTISAKFDDDSERKIFSTLSIRCRRFWAFWLILVPLYLTPARILVGLKRFYHFQKAFLFRWH
jgi:glycosyltransferase involved in cell wall biosynthesis